MSQPDVIRVAQEIEKCIQRLDKGENALNRAASARAIALAEYDGLLGVTLIKLRNGVPMTLRGEAIKDPPASTSDKIAKGICEEAKMKLELADAHYRVVMSKIDNLKARLNGWQSIYKRLDNV